MSDNLEEQIEAFFQRKGYGATENRSRHASELAALLREQSPKWDWTHIGAAARNSGFYLAILAMFVSGYLIYSLGKESFRWPLSERGIQTCLVGFWLVAPPVWFFIELYFRGHNSEAREKIKPYHEAAQRIWLAVAAVLASLYGLSLKG